MSTPAGLAPQVKEVEWLEAKQARHDPCRLGDCRFNDATGLPGGDSRFFLASIGFVTLDATGLPGGGSRFGVAGILTAFKA